MRHALRYAPEGRAWTSALAAVTDAGHRRVVATPMVAAVLLELLAADTVWIVSVCLRTGLPGGLVGPIVTQLRAAGWVDTTVVTNSVGVPRRMVTLTVAGRRDAQTVINELRMVLLGRVQPPA